MRPSLLVLLSLGPACAIACSSEGVQGPGASTSSSSSAGSGASTGTSPGGVGGGSMACRTTADCSIGTFCQYEDDVCGTTELWGGCAPREDCEEVDGGERVCACDGKVYDNVLCAHAARSDISQDATLCTFTGTLFACGYQVCDWASEYCAVTTYPGETLYACDHYPPLCAASPPVDCGCFGQATCAEAPGGAITVTTAGTD